MLVETNNPRISLADQLWRAPVRSSESDTSLLLPSGPLPAEFPQLPAKIKPDPDHPQINIDSHVYEFHLPRCGENRLIQLEYYKVDRTGISGRIGSESLNAKGKNLLRENFEIIKTDPRFKEMTYPEQLAYVKLVAQKLREADPHNSRLISSLQRSWIGILAAEKWQKEHPGMTTQQYAQTRVEAHFEEIAAVSVTDSPEEQKLVREILTVKNGEQLDNPGKPTRPPAKEKNPHPIDLDAVVDWFRNIQFYAIKRLIALSHELNLHLDLIPRLIHALRYRIAQKVINLKTEPLPETNQSFLSDKYLRDFIHYENAFAAFIKRPLRNKKNLYPRSPDSPPPARTIATESKRPTLPPKPPPWVDPWKPAWHNKVSQNPA